ncbi:MAG TPA: hypothetical protein PKD53_18850 [Chloroflexaceae bacterium]|nr:hypothetical protein [Chloroflexaceae bacterium]
MRTTQPGPGEPTSHAFVLRVWREEGPRRPLWRGQITHVGSGARRSLTRLGQLEAFLCDYLEQLRVALPLAWRVRRWLGRHSG